ncbi:MAG TPA: beta-N-acetylhexosaminidase [Streptosporangiaceae bacterium]|nr:beta-N-acetylhexosaminidase [Streptosporangiaceae bacterium]
MPDRLATLLPYPAQVHAQPGHLMIHRDAPIVAAAGAQPEADAVTHVLAALPWPTVGHQKQGPEILVDTGSTIPAEGYRLVITPDRVKITAADPAGAFYAAQTIRQLLPDAAFRAAPAPGEAWVLPCAEIEDAPVLGWRGAHLDVSRHFFPKGTVLRFIDMLAAHKLNRLHLHLTDDQGWRIESPGHPALHRVGSYRPQTQVGSSRVRPRTYDGTPHGGYYTLDDLAEIASYAAQRMVTVVPEIEVPGHASALLAALPELSPIPGLQYEVATFWGITSQIVAPLPETVGVLQELFGELLGAIPAKIVHIGGDECVLDHWRDSARVAGYRRELGLPDDDALHAYFLRQVADMLADSFGVRSVVWDEGFASTGTGTRLRDDTLVMAWRGQEIGRKAALAGHDVISSPVMPTYFDYAQSADESEPLAIGGPITIEDVAGHRPVPLDLPQSAQRHLIGTQFQVWTEYIPDSRALDYMVFPRACALAEVAWHGGPAGWESHDGGRPALRGRVGAHLGRLDAAGIEYRPLDGPRPWQQGGTGARRHHTGTRIAKVANDLAEMAEGGTDLAPTV